VVICEKAAWYHSTLRGNADASRLSIRLTVQCGLGTPGNGSMGPRLPRALPRLVLPGDHFDAAAALARLGQLSQTGTLRLHQHQPHPH
jgi:hypothetical protein